MHSVNDSKINGFELSFELVGISNKTDNYKQHSRSIVIHYGKMVIDVTISKCTNSFTYL